MNDDRNRESDAILGSAEIYGKPNLIEVPELSNLKKYDKVKKACEYILARDDISTSSSSLPGREIRELCIKQFPIDIEDISNNTFYQYLSNCVGDTESRINCLGARQGYYLLSSSLPSSILNLDNDSTQEDLPNAKEVELSSSKAPIRQRERLLYPSLVSWLIARGYQASDVSTGRTLGKWGNPDVAGITTVETFNGTSVEIVSIEAKPSFDGWETWIFEAVSHRRFANRAYFAFAHSSEMIHKIPEDMRYYAELFNIGVLVVSVENEIFEELTQGSANLILEADAIEIREIYSAPYNFVQPEYQKKFLRAQGIDGAQELYHWGTSA